MTDKLPAFHIVGDAFADLFSFLDGDWPEQGGDAKLSQPIETYAGGSSTNTTTHLQALLNNGKAKEDDEPNALVLHTILNPDDHYGQILLKHAEKHGFPLVNCKQENDAAATGHCVAIVAGQERSFMTYRGCVDNFHASHLDVDSIINSDRHVHLHLAGYFNLSGFQDGLIEEKVKHIQNKRKERFPNLATVVSLVPQHDATKKWDGGIDDLTKCLDFLIMNDLEALHIMKQGKIRKKAPDAEKIIDPDLDDILIEECATYFGEISPRTCIVLTRGPSGAAALQGGKVVAKQSTVKVKPIDPTGAGDAFAAGFLHGLWAWRQQHQNQNQHGSGAEGEKASDGLAWPTEALQQSLLWGCTIGTSSVLVRGASFPSSKEDIQKYYAEIDNLTQ